MTTYSADYAVYRDDLAYMQDSSQKGIIIIYFFDKYF